MVANVFQNITDPVKRTVFFRAHKEAIARESARLRDGKPLPQNLHAKATEPMRGLFIKRNGQIMRCVPHGGIFGNSIRR